MQPLASFKHVQVRGWSTDDDRRLAAWMMAQGSELTDA